MDDEAKALVFGLVCALFGAFLGAVSAYTWTQNAIRADAAEHGAAEYLCDPVTGERTFHWLPQEPTP